MEWDLAIHSAPPIYALLSTQKYACEQLFHSFTVTLRKKLLNDVFNNIPTCLFEDWTPVYM